MRNSVKTSCSFQWSFCIRLLACFEHQFHISNKKKNAYFNFILSLASFFDYVDTVKKNYEKLWSFAGLVISFIEGLVAMFKNL